MKSLAAARHSSQLTSIIKSAEAGARLVRSRQGSSMLGHLRSEMLDTFGIATSIQVIVLSFIEELFVSRHLTLEPPTLQTEN